MSEESTKDPVSLVFGGEGDRERGKEENRGENIIIKSKVIWIEVNRKTGTIAIFRKRRKGAARWPLRRPIIPFFTGSMIGRLYSAKAGSNRWGRVYRALLLSHYAGSYSAGDITHYFMEEKVKQ